MPVKDLIIYSVVGSFLGVVVVGLLFVWILKKCWHPNNSKGYPGGGNINCGIIDPEKSPPTPSNHSVISTGSKKPLLNGYGSTRQKSLSSDSLPIQFTAEQAKFPDNKTDNNNDRSERQCYRADRPSCTSVSSNEKAGYRSSLEFSSQPSTDSETHPSYRSKSSSITDAHPIGSIRPDLYTRKGSLFMQGASKDFAIGRMHLRLKYDFKRSDLVIKPIKVTGINSSVSKFCLKVYLSTNVEKAKQSKTVRRKDANFEFEDEEFKFPITFDELGENSLIVQLYETSQIALKNVGKPSAVLGEVNIDLSNADSSADIEIVADIEPSKSAGDNLGELLIDLNYLPSVERLSITVVKARLKCATTSDDWEYFVKAVVLMNEKLLKKKKTNPVKCKRNGQVDWNEEVSFRLMEAKLKETQIDLTVYRKHAKEQPDIIGRIVLATDAPNNPGKKHWKETLKHNGTVTMWHKLQYCPLSCRRFSD